MQSARAVPSARRASWAERSVALFAFIHGANDFAHTPNFVVRGLKELHIGFTPRI